jgi:hypothetical protein
MWEPKVGDVVRVLVDRDRDGDVMDINVPYVVEDVDDYSVLVRRKDPLPGGMNWFDVEVFNVVPFDIRELLQYKMDQLTQLQREIAALEAQLEGDGE